MVLRNGAGLLRSEAFSLYETGQKSLRRRNGTGVPTKRNQRLLRSVTFVTTKTKRDRSPYETQSEIATKRHFRDYEDEAGLRPY